jgi:hypothetical protein
VCRRSEFQIARLSLRLILRRVRQRPFVLEHLAQVAALAPKILTITSDTKQTAVILGTIKDPRQGGPANFAARPDGWPHRLPPHFHGQTADADQTIS